MTHFLSDFTSSRHTHSCSSGVLYDRLAAQPTGGSSPVGSEIRTRGVSWKPKGFLTGAHLSTICVSFGSVQNRSRPLKNQNLVTDPSVRESRSWLNGSLCVLGCLEGSPSQNPKRFHHHQSSCCSFTACVSLA